MFKCSNFVKTCIPLLIWPEPFLSTRQSLKFNLKPVIQSIFYLPLSCFSNTFQTLSFFFFFNFSFPHSLPKIQSYCFSTGFWASDQHLSLFVCVYLVSTNNDNFYEIMRTHLFLLPILASRSKKISFSRWLWADRTQKYSTRFLWKLQNCQTLLILLVGNVSLINYIIFSAFLRRLLPIYVNFFLWNFISLELNPHKLAGNVQIIQFFSEGGEREPLW